MTRRGGSLGYHELAAPFPRQDAHPSAMMAASWFLRWQGRPRRRTRTTASSAGARPRIGDDNIESRAFRCDSAGEGHARCACSGGRDVQATSILAQNPRGGRACTLLLLSHAWIWRTALARITERPNRSAPRHLGCPLEYSLLWCTPDAGECDI